MTDYSLIALPPMASAWKSSTPRWRSSWPDANRGFPCSAPERLALNAPLVQPLIHARVRESVKRWVAGARLEGQIDIRAGY
jgi:hypothetical protein